MDLFDSRINYPLNPPVHNNVTNSMLQTVLPASSELYAPFNSGETNQLYYSGGTNQMLKIPLQILDDSILRSQNVLITPYNRIKYSNKGSC